MLNPATQIVFDAQGRIVGGAPPMLSSGGFRLAIDPVSGVAVLQ
jgi:hypothetical protein